MLKQRRYAIKTLNCVKRFNRLRDAGAICGSAPQIFRVGKQRSLGHPADAPAVTRAARPNSPLEGRGPRLTYDRMHRAAHVPHLCELGRNIIDSDFGRLTQALVPDDCARLQADCPATCCTSARCAQTVAAQLAARHRVTSSVRHTLPCRASAPGHSLAGCPARAGDRPSHFGTPTPLAQSAGTQHLTIHSSGTIIVPIIVRLTQALGVNCGVPISFQSLFGKCSASCSQACRPAASAGSFSTTAVRSPAFGNPADRFSLACAVGSRWSSRRSATTLGRVASPRRPGSPRCCQPQAVALGFSSVIVST